jgi:hypothetical protein
MMEEMYTGETVLDGTADYRQLINGRESWSVRRGIH